MIFYEIGHLEWFFFFRGAPSGYFGESSAGTFNPSWYLNDLGTMYKRVGLLILTFCSAQICWNTPLYACRFNFQDPAHFSREPPTHAFHAFKVHIFRDPLSSLLTFSGTMFHPCLHFQGPSFIPPYSTERCVGNGSPCLYRAGLVRTFMSPLEYWNEINRKRCQDLFVQCTYLFMNMNNHQIEEHNIKKYCQKAIT